MLAPPLAVSNGETQSTSTRTSPRALPLGGATSNLGTSEMAPPRIVKATCPQCGAGLHIAPGAAVVTCDYCKLSSLIERPDSPKTTPPTDGQRYGTIQIDPRAGTALLGVYLAVAAVVLFVGLGAGIAGAVRLSRTPPSPVRDPSSDGARLAGLREGRGLLQSRAHRNGRRRGPPADVNAHRMMFQNDCVKQTAVLRRAAQTYHRTCN